MEPEISHRGRGLTKEESKALLALQIFLMDYGVTDIDLEPQVKGFTIKANRIDGKTAFASWGNTITDAVIDMVRCVTK